MTDLAKPMVCIRGIGLAESKLDLLCIISPFLFIMATDYLMNEVKLGRTLGFRWYPTTKQNYLAYADDRAFFLQNNTHWDTKYAQENFYDCRIYGANC